MILDKNARRILEAATQKAIPAIPPPIQFGDPMQFLALVSQGLLFLEGMDFHITEKGRQALKH